MKGEAAAIEKAAKAAAKAAAKVADFFSSEVNMINDDVLNMINDDYYIIIRGHPLKEDPRTSMDASRTSMENAYINIIK